MRPGTLRKADPEPGSLVRVALNRLDGPDSLGRPARGKQCRAKLGAHIDRDGAHEVHVCHAVSIEEGDAGFRSVIVADAEYGPAGLGDAHIGFRDLRGRDGWPGRLPSAGRIGLQPDGYQQRQNGFAQAGYPQGAPAQTKRQIFPSGEHRMQQRREAPPSRLLAAWRRFPRAQQLPKQLLWEHKLACHASPPMLPRMAPGSARSVVTASTIPIMTSKEPQAKRHAQRDPPPVHVSSDMPLHVHMLQRV